MIFHDVNKAAKGILKDFASSGESGEGVEKRPIEKRLRISVSSRRIEDFHEGQRAGVIGSEPGETHGNATIRLSPLSPGPTPNVRVGSGKLKLMAVTLVGISLFLIALLGYSAWNAAATEVAYARNGLVRITQDFAQVRSLYAAGQLKEAGAAFAGLSSRMEDFTWNLRMRLLLPNDRSGGTDTELPAATLDFVEHMLGAIRQYRQLYEHAGTFVSVGQGNGNDDLSEMATAFERGTTELLRARDILSSIRTEGMPEDLRTRLEAAATILSEVAGMARAVQAEMPAILDALGASYPRRYAILLQNADEMRPTGGFIGGVLFVDMNGGRMTGSEYYDVYELDWKLPAVEPAPSDLAGISPEYGLRDSNRFPDFPRSAREALSFFDKQGVPTVDGVIAINHHLLEDVLAASGPIRPAAVPVDLGAENVSQVLSLLVESKRNPEKPKAFIKDLVPTVLQRASAQPIPILRVFLEAIRRGDMAFYSTHPGIQEAIERSGLAGIPRTPLPSQDYLAITESNVGGNKSDRYVTEQVTHVTTVREGGAEDTVRVVRQHGFSAATAKSVRDLAATLGVGAVSDALMGIMGQGQNKTIVRVSVPLGSILRSTAGIPSDIVTSAEEGGKTVFTFPMNVLPGNVVDATLTYALPPAIQTDGKYELLIDKQIGQKTVPYDKRLEFAMPVALEGKRATEYGKRIDLDRSQTFSLEWE